ncbi:MULTISPECIES: hypothetical protein [Aliiglaciecola]|uniref:hypothetical protein n=1 Tax=Aliiglaciecola TaxID=1406885 RepID=UPI001C09287C|nr:MULTISPECIES: hypothetical protein [Aliiglaciecola]MBU2879348.1 hypothetical protein [Aliiglaciecola lipolytica]MDO6709799.1 hypothetical protein [Aliiglaciecola sp. 2_MG-2023]MDO6750659.1 hypothetical protein [Aliiglaciecola sp. 1_MG-2023]
MLTAEDYEQTSGNNYQIEALYADAHKCAKKNVDLVVTLDEKGKAVQTLTNKDAQTNQCFLQLAKQ